MEKIETIAKEGIREIGKPIEPSYNFNDVQRSSAYLSFLGLVYKLNFVVYDHFFSNHFTSNLEPSEEKLAAGLGTLFAGMFGIRYFFKSK